MRRMLPPRRGGAQTRGQSLVEFALVLPVLLLIVLIGLDFGRSFLAWVGLNNAARIAANYASVHPDSWGTPGNAAYAAYKAEYAQLVTNDFQNAGCAAPGRSPRSRCSSTRSLRPRWWIRAYRLTRTSDSCMQGCLGW